MRRIYSSITALIIIILSGLQFAYAADYKYDATKICDIDTAKKYFSLEDKKQGDGYTNLEKELNDSNGDSVALKVRIAFEKARAQYHDTMKCVFDVATIQLLGAPAGLSDNITKDNLPDLTKALSVINDADKVCALDDDTKFRDLVDGTGAANFVPKLLDFYNTYSAFITDYLMKESEGITSDSSGNLSDALYDYNSLQMIMENEIQDSIVALDTATQTLKQMRLAFVMHVRFECMLKDLKLYQTMLKNLRSIVTVLPSAIIDASMPK